jgi:hypothetical protein
MKRMPQPRKYDLTSRKRVPNVTSKLFRKISQQGQFSEVTFYEIACAREDLAVRRNSVPIGRIWFWGKGQVVRAIS